MDEQWKPVEGYEDAYEVSDHGNVRTLDRTVHRERKFAKKSIRGDTRPVAGKLLARNMGGHNKRYCRVFLWKNNHSQTYYVHALVAAAFIGPRPAGQEINHIDADPANNRLSNLEYVSPAQNKQHGYFLRRGLIAGSNHWGQKLQEIDVSAIRCLTAKGFSQTYVAKRFGVSQSTVDKIAHGEEWKHSSLLPSAVADPREETT